MSSIVFKMNPFSDAVSDARKEAYEAVTAYEDSRKISLEATAIYDAMENIKRSITALEK